MSNVTEILAAIESGDPQATDKLLPIVYEELRRVAAGRLAREKPQTLQPTDLVHEAYLRLLGPLDTTSEEKKWESRAHFFGAAAEAMRRILVERARRKKRLKHGGGHERVTLDDGQLAVKGPSVDLLALDDALRKLAEEDRIKADLVKLRYFAGLKMEEVAAVLGVSKATADRYWTYAKAWLYHEITKGDTRNRD